MNIVVFAFLLIVIFFIGFIFFTKKIKQEIKKTKLETEDILRRQLEQNHIRFISEAKILKNKSITDFFNTLEKLQELSNRNFFNSKEVLDRVNALKNHINIIYITPEEEYEIIDKEVQILNQKIDNRTKDIYLNLEIEEYLNKYSENFINVKMQLETRKLSYNKIIQDLLSKYSPDIFDNFIYIGFITRIDVLINNANNHFKEAWAYFKSNHSSNAIESIKQVESQINKVNKEFDSIQTIETSVNGCEKFIIKNEYEIKKQMECFKLLCENKNALESTKKIKSTLEYSIDGLKKINKDNPIFFAEKLNAVLFKIKSSISKLNQDIFKAEEQDKNLKFDSEKRRKKNYEGSYDSHYDSLYI